MEVLYFYNVKITEDKIEYNVLYKSYVIEELNNVDY